MARNEFLRSLFDSHLADLNTVLQESGTTVICPICMTEYSEEDLGNGNLTDGHVWPEYIRKKTNSKIAPLQRVLLCKICNSTAGSRGDKQMQLREKIKDGEGSGEFYDERNIQIITTPGKEPITLRAKISLKEREIIEGQISFQVDKRTGQWIRNNPREQEIFLEATKNDKFTLIVNPPHELKSGIAPVGWITSAYLLAFYTFGYRYILHPSLDKVRTYILQSFDDEVSKILEMPDLDNFGLTECKEHYFDDPEIGLIIPMNREKNIHLQVSFIDYHIRLPLQFVSHVLEAMILNEPEKAKALQDNIGSDKYSYIPVACNKSNGHDCLWDYVLGKPIPIQN